MISYNNTKNVITEDKEIYGETTPQNILTNEEYKNIKAVKEIEYQYGISYTLYSIKSERTIDTIDGSSTVETNINDIYLVKQTITNEYTEEKEETELLLDTIELTKEELKVLFYDMRQLTNI